MKKLFCCISDPGVEDTRTRQLGADSKRAVTSDISSSRGQKRNVNDGKPGTAEVRYELLESAVTDATRSAAAMRQAPLAASTGVVYLDPTQDALLGTPDTFAPLVEKLSVFTNLVLALGDIHPYAKIACSIFAALPKAIVDQTQRDKNIQALLDEVTDIYTLAATYATMDTLDDPRRKILHSLVLKTVDCAYFIRDQSEIRSFIKRVAQSSLLGTNIDQQISEFKEAFVIIRNRLADRGALETEIRMFNSLSSIDDVVELQQLAHVRSAGLDSSKACLPGTRAQILDDLSAWVNNPNACRSLFLIGVAGAGKSAIAHSLGLRFEPLRRLGCFFAFNRDFQTDRNPQSVLGTIAHELAGTNPEFKRALACALRDDGTLSHTRDIKVQWDKLIVQPSRNVTFIGPVLIIIDAFDESGHYDGSSNHARSLLLDCLTKGTANLPQNFRILLTSRPENDVSRVIRTIGSDIISRIELDLGSTDVAEDIKLYVHRFLTPQDPDEGELDEFRLLQISDKAEGLFQWASTACRVILANPAGLTLRERFDERLEPFLQGGRTSLDDLYSDVLRQTFTSESATVMTRFRSVMAQMMCTSYPLSIDTLQSVRTSAIEESKNDVALILHHMGALLSGVNDRTTPIRPLHTSFRDFLLDSGRSRAWHIDLGEGDLLMCLGLVRALNDGVRFNICRLQTSYVRNTDVPDLRERVTSKPLRYAAGYLKHHIPLRTNNETLVSALEELLQVKVLYWLELLSVLGYVGTATTVLKQLSTLFTNSNASETLDIIRDITRFVDRFAVPIAQAAPHVYLSALPFVPASSLLKERFASQFPHIPVINGTPEHWSRMRAVIKAPESVYAAAFSSDGQHIVAGLYDNTVCIWDAETGEPTGEPLRGHSATVRSIAWSPKKRQVVSGSVDMTVRVWDMAIGEAALEPLHGHLGAVWALAYSPDGTRIVSGSADATVRIWEASTGRPVGKPLVGHSAAVWAVAHSPTSPHILSGSEDGTLRVWDAKTGRAIGKPLTYDDATPVYAVAYSPDGFRAVSGSQDCSLRIWDLRSCHVVGLPLLGHTGAVLSVEYSQDGRHIISGSRDATVRVWDAETGVAIGQPFEGHSAATFSVKYSPNGRSIMSGSYDLTLRIWDADVHVGIADEGAGAKLHHGHTLAVRTLALSPDGRHVASGSSDLTLRIWDIDTGDLVHEPLRGHTGALYSLAYSPDGRRIASASEDSTVRIWRVALDEAMGIVNVLSGHSDAAYTVAYSPNAERITSASEDNTVIMWDAHTGQKIGTLLRHSAVVWSVAYSPDGRYIASGSDDKTVRLWDADTGEAIRQFTNGHTDFIWTIAFSPDGRHILSGGKDCTVRVWETATGSTVGSSLRGHTEAVEFVAFSPDSRYIASGSGDWTVRLWDSKSGEATGEVLHGHSSGLRSALYTLDGRRIVTCSIDTTIRVWESERGPTGHADHQPLLNFHYPSNPPNATPLRLRWNLEGWIVDEADNLLIWVPGEYRNSLWWPRMLKLIGGYEPNIKIDFLDARHGTEWASCTTSPS